MLESTMILRATRFARTIVYTELPVAGFGQRLFMAADVSLCTLSTKEI